MEAFRESFIIDGVGTLWRESSFDGEFGDFGFRAVLRDLNHGDSVEMRPKKVRGMRMMYSVAAIIRLYVGSHARGLNLYAPFNVICDSIMALYAVSLPKVKVLAYFLSLSLSLAFNFELNFCFLLVSI